MTNIIVIFVVFGVLAFLFGILQGKTYRPRRYNYKSRNFFMSRAEHECYDALVKAVGDKYYIFPQVHLPSIVDNKVNGQSWRGAFMHISQKSVDFVLCDKAYISPKLAIELDDQSHERKDRQERDLEVERVLNDAKLPLLRLENHGQFDFMDLQNKVDFILNNAKQTQI